MGDYKEINECSIEQFSIRTIKVCPFKVIENETTVSSYVPKSIIILLYQNLTMKYYKCILKSYSLYSYING